MTERYEAIAVRTYQDRDGNEKSSFTNIGVAWAMKERDGYTLRLHAMPAPADGEYTILLFPPKPKEEQQQQSSNQRQKSRNEHGNQQPANFSRDLDDDIPFACEWR